MDGAMGARKDEAGDAVDDQAAEEHGAATDPVGDPPARILEEDAGGEERGHDQTGQEVGASEAPDVDGQHGHDGGRRRATGGRRSRSGSG